MGTGQQVAAATGLCADEAAAIAAAVVTCCISGSRGISSPWVQLRAAAAAAALGDAVLRWSEENTTL